MKKIILILLISFSAFSQKTIYNKTNKEGVFKEYQTKDGNTLKVGDTIEIGYPQGSGFRFITQGNEGCASFLANNKTVVSKIKTVGNTTRGFKTYALFKGYGLSVYIDYEAALETGEIKNPFTKIN